MYYKVIYDEMIQNEKGKRARSKGMSTHKVWIRKQTWFWLVTTIISLFFLITNIVPFSLVLRFLFIVLLLYIVSFYLMQSTSQRKRVTTIRVIKNVDSSKNSFFFLLFFSFFCFTPSMQINICCRSLRTIRDRTCMSCHDEV
jgi:Ca2+/Na+ antiporter